MAELRQPLADAIADFNAQHQTIGAGRDTMAGLGATFDLEIGRIVSNLAMPARPNQVDGAIHGNPMQPGPEISPGFESAQLLVCP